jgi:hypothetical protein
VIRIITYWGDLLWLPKHRTSWSYAFAILPHKCVVSGDWIWFKMGYRAKRVLTGPGTPITEFFWFSKDEFLLMLLRGYRVH